MISLDGPWLIPLAGARLSPALYRQYAVLGSVGMIWRIAIGLPAKPVCQPSDT
jgi:hypothetical protein